MARSRARSTRNSPASVTTPAARSAAPIAAPAAMPDEDEIMDDMNTTADTINAAADQAQNQAKTMFADAGERTKGAFTKGTQMVGELGEFGKGNVEALVESSKIAAKGMEQFGQAAAVFVRSQFEEAQAQARTLAAASSPTEFLKLQSDFVRTAFDRMVAETSKNTEAMMKLAGEVAQPISNRVALATDKMKVSG